MSSASAGAPLVSVVVATYDRPRALAAALAGLVAQTVTDWEAVVVGDACDDRTGAVVAGVGDPRLRYVNLARNVGEQSGPNNMGAALARGELIAYLNHDDLWFPDHLATNLEALRSTCADLVFAANANVLWSDPDGHAATVVLDGRGADGRYDPAATRQAVPASTWLARRSLIDELDGWRAAGECRVEPSQDLLFRAHRSGARLRATGALTVVTFPAGVRDDAYVGDQGTEQERWLPRLGDPAARAELLASVAASVAVERRRPVPGRQRAWDAALRLASWLGLDARSLDFALRRRFGKGEYLDELRRRRGLHALAAGGSLDAVSALWRRQARAAGPPAFARPLSFGRGGEGVVLLAGGWSHLEDWGVWNDGRCAQLVVELPPGERSDRTLVLDVEARANTSVPAGRQRVNVRAGSTEATWDLPNSEATNHRLEVLLEGRRFVTVELDLPLAGPAGDDTREMAIGLERLTVTLI